MTTSNKSKKLVIICGALLALSIGAEAQDFEALHRCATIDDDRSRLACYDSYSGRKTTAPADEQTTETSSEEPIYDPLTDDIGVRGLNREDREPAQELLVRATVTSCRKDANNDYFFFFENGQVWKQKDDDRLRHRNCEFDVTITKDVFGYKMQIDGEKRRTRISRVR